MKRINLIISVTLAVVIASMLYTKYSKPKYEILAEVTVHQGDTLWDITSEQIENYGSTKPLNEVIWDTCRYNNLKSGGKIASGMKIVVPLTTVETERQYRKER